MILDWTAEGNSLSRFVSLRLSPCNRGRNTYRVWKHLWKKTRKKKKQGNKVEVAWRCKVCCPALVSPWAAFISGKKIVNCVNKQNKNLLTVTMDHIDTTTYRRTYWSDKKDLVYSPLHWHHPCTLVHHSTLSQNLQHASPAQLVLQYTMKVNH